MLKNKRGTTPGYIWVLMALIGILVVGGGILALTQFAVQKEEATPEAQAEELAPFTTATNRGKTTSLVTTVQDVEGKAQVASTWYALSDFDGNKKVTSKTTAASGTTSQDVTNGANIKSYAFDTVYYPLYVADADPSKDQYLSAGGKVGEWGQTFDITGFTSATTYSAAIATKLNFTYIDDDATLDSVDTEANTSIGTGTTGTFTVRLKNKQNNERTYLKGVIFDTTNTTSVVSGIDAKTNRISSALTSKTNIPLKLNGIVKPQQLSNTADYIFGFDEVVPLSENTGFVDVDVTVTKTSTTADEGWSIYVVDASCYQSVQNPDVVNCGAIQNDADTPSDIAGPNYNQSYAGMQVK